MRRRKGVRGGRSTAVSIALIHQVRKGNASQPVTEALRRWRGGDEAAQSDLVDLVYPELQRLAQRYIRRERRDHTLDATALVHEAYLRLVRSDVEWADRVHFFAVAARVMRRVLVDHGRSRRRQRRGGDLLRVTLPEGVLPRSEPQADVVMLDEALSRLSERDERKARAVELHFFGGMNYDEIAEALGISVATVGRELRFAKAWLHGELSGTTAGDG